MKEDSLEYKIASLETKIQLEYQMVAVVEDETRARLIEIGKLENILDLLYMKRAESNADKVQT